MSQNPQVLVVDDSKFERTFLTGILREEGWNVIAEAADGLEGLQKYVELTPDVVMMDITMPRMDGLAALKAIMQINPEARVVIVTAMSTPDKFREAINNGAKDFIVKPFSQAKVKEVLAHVFRA